MRVKRLAGAVAVTAVLAALSGCSGDETTTVSDDPTASSSPAEPSSPEESASDSEEPEEVSDGYGKDELLEAMKAAVEDNETAHMVMDISGGGQSMNAEGDVSYAGDSTSMQLTMQAPELGQGTIEMRMVDNTMYMSMPPATPEGKFMKFDLDDPNSPFGGLGGVTQGDPLQTFAAFDAGLRKVRYVGQEDVDGEQMDHYLLTVDGKAAAEAQGSPAGAMPKNLTYDLWLDEDDLMRRVQYSMQGGGVTITMSDWGEPVTVKAPPAGAIVQVPGMQPG